MKIPSRIYEIVPYLYIVLGTLALFASANLIGALSALLLIAIAGFIVKLRIEYRSGQEFGGHRLRRSS